MADGGDRTLDHLADYFAAVEAAREYGFDMGAAMQAAADRLAHLDQAAAVTIAAAAIAFTAVDMRPRVGVDIDQWAQHWAFLLALAERRE